MKRIIGIFAIFVLCFVSSGTGFAQTSSGNLDSKAILEMYRDVVVDVETTLTVEVSGGLILMSSVGDKFLVEISGHETEIVRMASNKLKFGGTGFFVDADGSLLTNAHVVKIPGNEINFGPFGSIRVVDYEYWVVQSEKQKKFRAELVGMNTYADNALLKVEGLDPKEFKVAKLGDSDRLAQGDVVYCYGSPYHLSGSLSDGKVSGLHRQIGLDYLEDFIQHTASTAPGNSGSPLINGRGEVIGIHSAGIRTGASIGFAIPASLVDVANLKTLKGGNTKLGWLGMEALLENFDRSGDAGNPSFEDVRQLNAATDIDDRAPCITIMLPEDD